MAMRVIIGWERVALAPLSTAWSGLCFHWRRLDPTQIGPGRVAGVLFFQLICQNNTTIELSGEKHAGQQPKGFAHKFGGRSQWYGSPQHWHSTSGPFSLGRRSLKQRVSRQKRRRGKQRRKGRWRGRTRRWGSRMLTQWVVKVALLWWWLYISDIKFMEWGMKIGGEKGRGGRIWENWQQEQGKRALPHSTQGMIRGADIEKRWQMAFKRSTPVYELRLGLMVIFLAFCPRRQRRRGERRRILGRTRRIR